MGQNAHRGKTLTSFFSNMTLQKYFWITSDIFVTSEYVICVLKYTVSWIYWIHPVCLLTFRVRLVASTVQDGFFPYLVQMINSMRGCVACDDPWP